MRRLALLTALLALGLASPAAAASDLQRVFQDDPVLLRSSDAERDAVLDALKAMGVDIVRVNLQWRRLPDPQAPEYERVDGLVAAAHARQLKVLATLTTPAPDRHSSRRPGAKPGTYRPSAVAFGAFAEQAGRRYPDMDLWSLVNEPNSPNQIMPQFSGGRPESPAIYRRLTRAALKGLTRAGHDTGEKVLLGEQLGVVRDGDADGTPVPPLTFVEHFFCLTAKARDCAAKPRFDVKGWSVHPYGYPKGPGFNGKRGGLYPGTAHIVLPLLDEATRRHRLTNKLDVWDTESGYQTNPPDPRIGIPPARAARFLNESEEMLHRRSRVRSYAQYGWRDEPREFGFQSALSFADGRPKASLSAYRMPLVARRTGPTRAELWGRVHPLDGPAATLTGPNGLRRTVAAGEYFRIRVAIPRKGGAFRMTSDTTGARSRTALIRAG